VEIKAVVPERAAADDAHIEKPMKEALKNNARL
jgi:hypothetical protein